MAHARAGSDIPRPLKAPNEPLTIAQIRELVGCRPLLSSRKFDGNRMLIIGGNMYSSSMKEPRNERLLEHFAPLLEYSGIRDVVFDCEFYSKQQSHHAETSGVLNSFNDFLPDDLQAYIFDAFPRDHWDSPELMHDYCSRVVEYHEHVTRILTDFPSAPIQAVNQRVCESDEDIATLFQQDLRDGFEGSMLRTLTTWMEGSRRRGGFYKKGRATKNEAIIYKLKEFFTTDGIIIGVQRRRKLREDWPRTTDAWGHLIRPTVKEAYTVCDCVGAFFVAVPSDDQPGIYTFTKIGFRRGFDIPTREAWWIQIQQDPHAFLGRWVEFKHQPHGAMHGGKFRMGGLTRFRNDLPAVPALDALALFTDEVRSTLEGDTDGD